MCRSFVIPFVLIITLAGCALEFPVPTPSNKPKATIESLQADLKSFDVGHHISEIIQRVGPPHKVASDEAGGKIYIYIFENSTSVSQYSHVPTPPKTNSYTHPEQKSSVTRGKMWYNPYTKRYEWKSETRKTSGNRIIDAINAGQANANSNANSNPFISGLNSSPQKVVTGHTTRVYSVSVMYYVNPDKKVYNVLVRDW